MAKRRTTAVKTAKDKRVSVHFRIHPDVARDLRTFAAHHGKRYSDIVREAVEIHMSGFYVVGSKLPRQGAEPSPTALIESDAAA